MKRINLVFRPCPKSYSLDPRWTLDDICDNDHSDAESLLSQDILITSPKIDFLSEEFTGEFAPIPPGMDEDEFDEEKVDYYDHDTSSDNDSYENIEYVEASPINLEYDNLEEENEDQEEKGARYGHERIKILNQGEIVLSLNVEDVNPFIFVIWIFLPFFTYPEDSPVILSFSSEDLIFDPDISTFQFSLKPVPFATPKDEVFRDQVNYVTRLEPKFSETSPSHSSVFVPGPLELPSLCLP
ncbi:hypothetical protein Tco_0575577 [Tanacetum coccineum]